MIPNGNTPILQCTTPRAFYEEIITINLQLTGKSCLMVELKASNISSILKDKLRLNGRSGQNYLDERSVTLPIRELLMRKIKHKAQK